MSDDVAKAEAIIGELEGKRTARAARRAAHDASGNALPLPRTRSRTPGVEALG